MGCGSGKDMQKTVSDPSSQRKVSTPGQSQRHLVSQLAPQNLQTSAAAPPSGSPASSASSPTPSSHREAQPEHTQSPFRLSHSKEHDNSQDEMDDDAYRKDDDVELPPIVNPSEKLKSPSPTHAGPMRATKTPSRRSSTGLSSSSNLRKNLPEQKWTPIPAQVGCCPHCPHCRKTRDTRISSSVPKWLREKPATNEIHINMDKYDSDAMKKNEISAHGHLHGSYDYKPQLIMERMNDYDWRPVNYCTLPFLAKTTPTISPTHTPFPDYSALLRREQRVNKPFSLPLFVE